jgi:hypothetical protein
MRRAARLQDFLTDLDFEFFFFAVAPFLLAACFFLPPKAELQLSEYFFDAPLLKIVMICLKHL